MNNIRRSLAHALDHSSIIEAGVRMLEEGRYYYTLTVDPGYESTGGDAAWNGAATTNLEMITSRIFDTYEDAVLALNIRIGQTVVEGGLLPA